MKPDYLYAIVSAEGDCRTIVGRATEQASLPGLLADGWRPVRETPFPNLAGEASILICLEREPEGQLGFGFGR